MIKTAQPPLTATETTTERTSLSQRITSQPIAAAFLFCVALLAFLLAALPILRPPAPVPSDAAPSVFSAGRAQAHLSVIAAEPHPVGSPANAQVRDYLIEQIRLLGLEPVVQDATGVLSDEAGVFASSLHNVLVRIPGQASTGAVLIMAHYDSQPNTPGASDNGAAAAGLIESMRAIQAGPPLRNDLIFALTDAEEVDAQGADAFFWQHPWAKDVRLVVNFEAAGTTGASMLLETSPGNAALAAGFVQAVPHPVANSFLVSLLGVIPLGTDLTVFTDNGVPGLNPMFGWGYHTVYHSYLDRPDTLNSGSLQQQGENALALARYFAGQDLTAPASTDDATFFNLLPGIVIRYSSRWAAPLALLLMAIFVATLAFGVRRRRLSLVAVTGASIAALLAVIAALVVAAVAWMAIAALHPEFWRNIMGAPYGAEIYLLGLAGLVLAAILAVMNLLRRRLSGPTLACGAITVWLLFALLTAFTLPSLSFVFTLPALAATLLLVATLARPEINPSVRLGAVAAVVAVGFVIVTPVIVLLYMLMGFWFLTMSPSAPFIIVPLLFVALLAILLIPQVDILASRRARLVPLAVAVVALGLFIIAGLSSGYSAGRPMQNGVWYELNADSGDAAWYSYGEKPEDSWTVQFFPGPVRPADLAAVYAATPENPLPAQAFSAAAPVAPLPAPQLQVFSDSTSNGVRSLHLHINSPRLARGLRLRVSGAPVLAATVNNVRKSEAAWAGRSDWFLRYYGMTAGGLDLELETASGSTVTVTVADQADGLPALPGASYTPRSSAMMPFAMAQEYMPYPETNGVVKTYAIQ